MIVAIVGCSGSGKTLLTNILMKKFNFACPIHTTCRQPRKNDNGFYKYISKEEFLDNIKADKFFIQSGDGIRYYGIENEEMEKVRKTNKNVVINISIKDLENIKKKNSDIFIIMTIYNNLILDYFRFGVIKKVGMLESVKRLFIYLSDIFKNRKVIKETVNYKLKLNKIYSI